jgi:hypothetical protein
MPKRSGRTEKISVSVRSADLVSLRRRAARLYDGNLSAVISELAADAALLEGMHSLALWLGGPDLSDEERDEIDRELATAPGPSARPARKRKPGTAA